MNKMNMIILTVAIAFAVGIIAAKFWIPALRRLKAGGSIREEGPKWHMSKQGTPIMGGLIFITALIIALVVMYFVSEKGGQVHGSMLLVLTVLSLINGVIGFIDDYVKVKKHRNLGLTAIQKLALQIAASVCFLLLLRNMGYISSGLYIPFVKVWISLPWFVYMIIGAFIIVGCVNAVNLTDGVDGLATGVTMPVCVFFIAAGISRDNLSVAMFAAALLGGLGAFLVFNFNPAKIFMGDTGSLFLGGAVAAMAFALDMPVILIPVGIVYICEALSVIMQVGYFKLTHGKRIFKMSPLHHHFEMCGWNEKKVFAVFTAVCALGCIVGYLGI